MARGEDEEGSTGPDAMLLFLLAAVSAVVSDACLAPVFPFPDISSYLEVAADSELTPMTQEWKDTHEPAHGMADGVGSGHTKAMVYTAGRPGERGENE